MKHFISNSRYVWMAGLWLLLWQAAALAVDQVLILPGPFTVLGHSTRIVTKPENLLIILQSGAKILGGILSALGAGILAAGLAVKRPLLRDFLAPMFAAVKSVPVASFVILLLLWQGAERLSGWVSFLIAWPVFYEYLLLGLSQRDRNTEALLRVFGVASVKRLVYITVPAVYKPLQSALSLAVGMSWKAGVAAEVIATPIRSVGNELYRSRILLETADVFAWTLLIIGLGYGTEWILGWLFTRLMPEGVEL